MEEQSNPGDKPLPRDLIFWGALADRFGKIAIPCSQRVSMAWARLPRSRML
ncbi:MAG: hypothetical protein HC807_00495 [Gammaproteobacteria bacterium]|nr:hypothetical protein [Gammaproteobacteria bacterium]